MFLFRDLYSVRLLLVSFEYQRYFSAFSSNIWYIFFVVNVFLFTAGKSGVIKNLNISSPQY